MKLSRTWNWKWVAATALMLLIGVAAQWSSWKDIWRIAVSDEESSQIFLVPIVAAYLVWVRRARFRHTQPAPSWIGPVIVVLGSTIGLIGDNFAYQAFEHLGAVVVAVGCVVSVLGKEFLGNFLPVFSVLVFLIPVPPTFRQYISIPLERITAILTQEVLDVLGVAVERSGNLLSINGTNVTIAEACNGLRMVFALTLVCYMYAFGEPLRWYVRLLVLVASPVAGIACNLVRLVPTVWFYGNMPPNIAELFHDVSGWAMLVVAFLLLMAIISLLRWALVPVSQFTLASD